jgi:hypothetical protein
MASTATGDSSNHKKEASDIFKQLEMLIKL